MIYFIVEEGGEYVKIGKANDPDRRLVALQCGNARTLTLAKVVDAPDNAERQLHRILRADRAAGEWFRMSVRIEGIISGTESGNALMARALDAAAQRLALRAPRDWTTFRLYDREWMTVAEAADAAGVEVVTVYKSIERERITSTRLLDTLVVVPLDEVLALWPQAETEPVA